MNSFVGERITNPSDIISMLGIYAKKRQEHFGVICLDSAHKVISRKVLFIGGVSNTTVDAKVLYWELLKKKASAFIVFHNHPSGYTEPSTYDVKTTETLIKGSELLGLQLLDHVIIGKHDYYSFHEHKVCFE